MRLLPRRDIDHEAWDTLSRSSDDAWLFHGSRWIEIEREHFSRDEVSVGVVDKSGLLALLPLYLSDNGVGQFSERLLHCGIHRHTGLAVRADITGAELKQVRSLVMRYVFSQASSHEADRIYMNESNLAPRRFAVDHEDVPFWVADYGFQLGVSFGPHGLMPCPGMSICVADQIVDLTPSEDVLFRRVRDRCNVRKAQETGVTFEPAATMADLSSFHEIAAASAARTGEAIPPLRYYLDIWNAFFGSGQCAVLFARKGDKRVAALFLMIAKRRAWYLAGCSDPEYLSMRVNDFIFSHAMVHAKRQGVLHYRFGPAFPEVPADWPIARVSRFKTKFGARSVPVLHGSWFMHPEKYRENGSRLLDLLCAWRIACERPMPSGERAANRGEATG